MMLRTALCLLMSGLCGAACTGAPEPPCDGRFAEGGACPDPACQQVRARYLITGRDGCFMGILGDLSGLGQVDSALCFDAHTGGEPTEPQLFCRRLSTHLVQVVELSLQVTRVPEHFEACFSSDGEPLVSFFPSDCSPVCGDGIMEPGEACEPDMTWGLTACEAYFPWPGMLGTVSCSLDCTLDFSSCHSARPLH
ncbi:hypothetical protein KKC22_13205 [Myxococcota bacterium]|nr:hypothetical protein [Myxococcota bacterium]